MAEQDLDSKVTVKTRFLLFFSFIVAAFEALLRPRATIRDIEAMQTLMSERHRRRLIERRTRLCQKVPKETINK
jgi:hypothetical protein